MRRLIVSVVLAMPFVLGGCGDSDSSDEGSAKPADKPSKLVGKPAKQILADVVSDLGKVRSYHVQGRRKDEDGRASLSGEFSATGEAQLQVEQAGRRLQVRSIGATTYLRANEKFWRGEAGGAAASVLADRWVKTQKRDQRGLLERLSPRTLASCLSKGDGVITKKGLGSVAGQKTVVLHNDGSSPGSAPADTHVTATGRALPLRIVQTGPQKPGKPDPKCGDDDSKTEESDISLSKFDEPVQITAPGNALDLDKLPEGHGEPRRAS